jgi:hypothetical protein
MNTFLAIFLIVFFVASITFVSFIALAFITATFGDFENYDNGFEDE